MDRRRSFHPQDACAVETCDGASPCRSSSQPLRVALVVEAAGGGVAVHLVDLIRGLIRCGAEVHLVAAPGPRFDSSILTGDVQALCASVAWVPMQRSVSWRDMVSFVHVFRALAKIRPDVVHAHSSKAGVLARICFGPWRKVYTPHAVYTLNPYLEAGARRFYGSIERLFGCWFTDRIVAVSDDEAHHLRRDLRIPEHKVTTIYNGVPTFHRADRDAARNMLGLDPDACVVGVVGRLEFQKGIDRLVAIARRLERTMGRQVQIALIGAGDIEQVTGVPVTQLPSNIHLAGRVVDARRHFSAFDIFALPSRYEGFPYVYLEAMAAGLPIVTTRVAGADALVREWGIGVVVDNDDDVTQFTEAIEMLLQRQDLRREMSANCAIAAQRFSAQEMVARTVVVYTQLISETKR